MQYVIYVLVATPLLLGWLFWAGDQPPQPPLFHSGIDALQSRARPPTDPVAVSPKRVARNTAAPRNE